MRNRRRFLAATGQAAGVLALTSNGRIALAAPVSEFGDDAQVLQILARMTRLIYPHDGLDDSVYLGIVREMLGDSKNATTLRTGVANLVDFLGLDEGQQIAALQRIESGSFFNAVKMPLTGALYNSPELWAMIDYPGPSFAFGGYIDRGFDDIDWLPSS